MHFRHNIIIYLNAWYFLSENGIFFADFFIQPQKRVHPGMPQIVVGNFFCYATLPVLILAASAAWIAGNQVARQPAPQPPHRRGAFAGRIPHV